MTTSLVALLGGALGVVIAIAGAYLKGQRDAADRASQKAESAWQPCHLKTTLRREVGLMLRTTIATILTLLSVSGCASAVSDSGLCAGIGRAVTEHAAALAEDGGPQSLRTGDRLVRMIDAGCGS